MIKRLTVLAVLLTFVAGLPAQGLKDLMNKAKKELNGGSDDETGSGLKEALNAGVKEAVDFLSTPDGYYKSAYKILLPEEVL
ncbi:MAG: DUF4197 family protein, partial [Lewinella sp.]|nr:DUF4197 family protein [Lewinella sp.]